MFTILKINEAMELGRVSEGTVLIPVEPQIRSGKRNDFMVGTFMTPEGTAEFKIWEERTFEPVRENGPGIYDVVVEGSEFNGVYLTVRKIRPSIEEGLQVKDFLPQIPRERLSGLWKKVRERLNRLSVSAKAWKVLEEILADPEIAGRYVIEGAAIYHHDNKVGGLMHHSGKMLNFLVSVLENYPQLQGSADLLFLGVALHDVGKVFEYRDLGLGEFWYANHRVRGIELLAKYKDLFIENYDERFYRQLQSIISGHHGDYGDRPTTVAAAIVHYIDSMESQITGLLDTQAENAGGRLRFQDWGWLEPIDLTPEAETEDPLIS